MTTTPETDADFEDELKPGTKLLGDQYTITKFLNSGGFGITYLAKDSLDRDVVIKECFPESICRRNDSTVRPRSRAHQSSFGSVVELFVKEARNQAKLNHSNIASVHQVFSDNDTAYMAIDFIDGKDLLDTIEDRSVVTPENVEYWLRKTLDAVGFIHDNGMLHRDISPDNILVNKDNEPILIDFGAARENASQTNRALSTLRVVKDGYSPQEFYVQGSEQTPSSDLYAVAATFYHVITDKAPADSQVRLANIAQNTGDVYEPLAGNYPGYPEVLLKSIDRALSVLPVDRYESAEEWISVLDGEVVEERASPTTKAKSQKPTEEKPKSKTGPMLLLGGGAVAAAAVAGFFLLNPTGSDKPAEPDPKVETEVKTPEQTKADEPASTETSTETAATEPKTDEVQKPEPTPTPKPADVQTSSNDDIQSDLIATKKWVVELPFSTLPSPQAEGTFAMVVSTDAAMQDQLGIKLPTGTVIYSVNGNIVADNATISRAAKAGKDLKDQESLPAELRVKKAGSAQIETQQVTFPVGYETRLKNGMHFVSIKDDDAWVTRATRVPSALKSDLEVGDIIRSEAGTQFALNGPDAIGMMLKKIGTSSSAFLTVSRDGILKSVNLSLK